MESYWWHLHVACHYPGHALAAVLVAELHKSHYPVCGISAPDAALSWADRRHSPRTRIEKRKLSRRRTLCRGCSNLTGPLAQNNSAVALRTCSIGRTFCLGGTGTIFWEEPDRWHPDPFMTRAWHHSVRSQYHQRPPIRRIRWIWPVGWHSSNSTHKTRCGCAGLLPPFAGYADQFVEKFYRHLFAFSETAAFYKIMNSSSG